MMHNVFLSFNETHTHTHTGSFLPFLIQLCRQVVSVAPIQDTGMHFYIMQSSHRLLSQQKNSPFITLCLCYSYQGNYNHWLKHMLMLFFLFLFRLGNVNIFTFLYHTVQHAKPITGHFLVIVALLCINPQGIETLCASLYHIDDECAVWAGMKNLLKKTKCFWEP